MGMPGRLCATLLALLLLSTAALAQEKPDAPKPKHDGKVFIAGASLLLASKTADGIEGCPGHQVFGGRIFMENHPLGRSSSSIQTNETLKLLCNANQVAENASARQPTKPRGL